MFISTLPSELVTNIVCFLDNKSACSLVKTCKSINDCGKEYGYLSSLKTGMNDDILTFIRTCCEQCHILKSIEMSYMDNPHVWLPFLVERIVFNHCAITKYWNPGKRASIIKTFKLTDYNRYKFKTTLHVNWECFQNLEKLELYVYDVDLTGIDKLTKLKEININTSIKLSTFV